MPFPKLQLARVWRTLLFALLCLAAVPGAASADTYTSDELKFTADFPGTPEVKGPTDSEKDASGNVISHVVYVSVGKQGISMAAVFLDTFSVPFKVNVDASLAVERDNFLKGLSASIVTARSDTVSGHRAAYFTYDTPDHHAAGQGAVIIVEAEKPLIYLVITMYTPDASDEEKAAQDKFFASFQLL